MAIVAHDQPHGEPSARPPRTVSVHARAAALLPTAGAFLACAGAVAVATFLEPDPTHNDFERFHDQRLLVVFLALFVGLGLAYVRAALQPPALSRASAVAVALIAVAFLFASMPVGSRDLYLYAFYGKMWAAYGTNPYVHPVADFPGDAWQPYVQMQWSKRHMIYGPLFLWQSRLAGVLAGDNLYAAVWIFKTMAVAALAAVWWLVARLDAARVSLAGTLLLVSWNPLLLFEAAGNGHNDVVMVLLVVAAVWCWQQQRPIGSVALIALSFWYKWYGLLLLPVFLVAALRQHGVVAAVRLLAIGVATVVVTGFLALYWVPGAVAVIVGELRHPLALSQIYPTELSPVLAPWFWLLRATGVLDGARGVEVFHAGRTLLFGAAYLAILLRQWRQPGSLALLIESAFLAALAFMMLLMTILWPWHLMLPICLGLLTGRPAFVAVAIGLTIVGLLSYFLTLAIAALGLVLIVGAVALLRRGSTARPPLEERD